MKVQCSVHLVSFKAIYIITSFLSINKKIILADLTVYNPYTYKQVHILIYAIRNLQQQLSFALPNLFPSFE